MIDPSASPAGQSSNQPPAVMSQRSGGQSSNQPPATTSQRTGGTLTCPDCHQTGFLNLGRHINSQKCQAEQLKRRLKPGAAAPLPAATPATLPQPPADLASRLRSHRQTRRLADRIPRHARKQAAESLTTLLEECITNNDVLAWTRLFLFAYDSFSLPPADKKGNLTAVIKRNLLHGAPDCDAPSRQLPKTGRSQLRKAVERKISQGDISGAVRILPLTIPWRHRPLKSTTC